MCPETRKWKARAYIHRDPLVFTALNILVLNKFGDMSLMSDLHYIIVSGISFVLWATGGWYGDYLNRDLSFFCSMGVFYGIMFQLLRHKISFDSYYAMLRVTYIIKLVELFYFLKSCAIYKRCYV